MAEAGAAPGLLPLACATELTQALAVAQGPLRRATTLQVLQALLLRLQALLQVVQQL